MQVGCKSSYRAPLVLPSEVLTLVELKRLRDLREGQHFAGKIAELPDCLTRCGIEELAAQVHPIDPTICEPPVHLGLDANGVISKEERVNVESEWHGSIAELSDAVHRLKAPRHPHLDHVLAHRPQVGDHIDISRALVGRAVVNIGKCPVHIGQLGLEPCGSLCVSLRDQRGKGIGVVLAFLVEFLPGFRKLLVDSALFAQRLTSLPGCLLLLFHLGQVIRGEPQFLDAETVVAGRDSDRH